MICKRGIFVKRLNLRVPCGQCLHCRINTGRKWTGRILLENAYHATFTGNPGFFVTLTYSDDTVPLTVEGVPTLRKKELQTFLKVQHRLTPFRYYAVGEYGDVTLRPHYHMALFANSVQDATSILGHWKNTKGFVQAGPISSERARYLANYTAKKLTKDTDSRLERGQEPEFRLSTRKPPLAFDFVRVLHHTYSSGIGKQIVEERGDIDRTFRWNGKYYPIAPWLLDKARAKLGIPLLHRERLEHPGYSKWHEIQEAQWDPEGFKGQEVLLNGKKIQRLYRNETVNV
jgi:hypothetical protein